MNRNPLAVIEQMMLIIGSNDSLELTCDAIFKYLSKLLPLREFCLGFFQPEMQRTFLLSTTSAEGTKALYAYFPLSQKHLDFAQQAHFFENPTDKLVVDANDPTAKLMALSNYPVPFVQTRCAHPNLPYGSGTFMLKANVPIPPDALEIARGTRLPLNTLINKQVRFWELNQVNTMVRKENTRLRRKALGLPVDVDVDIIGTTGGLRETVNRLTQVAPLDVSLLITGETGTGKEVFARAVHTLSSRRNGPFVPVNCGAIPPSLIDNELFGHSKGAYTGAAEIHRGRFERANGGTLFLDEIGELPLEVQARLLRVLETRTVERLGGHEQIPVNFRLVVATHRNLTAMVEKGTFRQDLFYRLAVVSIHIPPLRERRQDIPLLASAFMKEIAQRFSLAPNSVEIPLMELQKLTRHDWPGNVRELQNTVEEAVALCVDGRLSFPELARSPASPLLGALLPKPGIPENALDNLPNKVLENTAPEKSIEHNAQNFPTYDEMVSAYLREALKLCHGKIQGKDSAAQLLGLHPNTLRTKLEKYGIR